MNVCNFKYVSFPCVIRNVLRWTLLLHNTFTKRCLRFLDIWTCNMHIYITWGMETENMLKRQQPNQRVDNSLRPQMDFLKTSEKYCIQRQVSAETWTIRYTSSAKNGSHPELQTFKRTQMKIGKIFQTSKGQRLLTFLTGKILRRGMVKHVCEITALLLYHKQMWSKHIVLNIRPFIVNVYSIKLNSNLFSITLLV